MEQNTPKFRLRLNLFDGIILALALIAAAVLAWLALNPTPAHDDDAIQGTARYSVRLSRWPEGTGALVQLEDQITDNLKDRPMGRIVDVRIEPCRMLVMNMKERRQVMAEIEGYEDILITIEAPCQINNYGVTVEEDDYPVRVGDMAYLRGEGYMGSGAVEFLEIVETFEDGQEAAQ